MIGFRHPEQPGLLLGFRDGDIIAAAPYLTYTNYLFGKLIDHRPTKDVYYRLDRAIRGYPSQNIGRCEINFGLCHYTFIGMINIDEGVLYFRENWELLDRRLPHRGQTELGLKLAHDTASLLSGKIIRTFSPEEEEEYKFFSTVDWAKYFPGLFPTPKLDKWEKQQEWVVTHLSNPILSPERVRKILKQRDATI